MRCSWRQIGFEKSAFQPPISPLIRSINRKTKGGKRGERSWFSQGAQWALLRSWWLLYYIWRSYRGGGMNIELKDFISETLKASISGVGEAQEHATDEMAAINPHGIQPNGGDYMMSGEGGIVVQEVQFDIAVATAERDEAEGGVGFLITVIGAGFKGTEETTRSAVNRVSFSVPVRLPLQPEA